MSDIAVWLMSVRKKFNLPVRAENHEAPRPNLSTEYWRGYADCLADVERRFDPAPKETQ